MKKHNIPSVFSVSNGYVAITIAAWCQRARYNLMGNVYEAQLDTPGNPFFECEDLVLYFNSATLSWGRTGRESTDNFPHFTSLKDFVAYITIPPRRVILNKDYVAEYVVGSDEFKVGCQTFPVSIIAKLADMIKPI